jgi:hypothetical protein
MPGRVYVQEIGFKTLDHNQQFYWRPAPNASKADGQVNRFANEKIAAAPPAGGAAAKAIKIARS